MLARPLMAVLPPNRVGVIAIEIVYCRGESRQGEAAQKPSQEIAAKAQCHYGGDCPPVIFQLVQGNASADRSYPLVRHP
jgi:hypothetical protein